MSSHTIRAAVDAIAKEIAHRVAQDNHNLLVEAGQDPNMAGSKPYDMAYTNARAVLIDWLLGDLRL